MTKTMSRRTAFALLGVGLPVGLVVAPVVLAASDAEAQTTATPATTAKPATPATPGTERREGRREGRHERREARREGREERRETRRDVREDRRETRRTCARTGATCGRKGVRRAGPHRSID